MNLRRYIPLFIALLTGVISTKAAAAQGQWADTAAKSQQAGTSDQTGVSGQTAQTRMPASQMELPNIKLLLQAAQVKFDPRRETAQAYLARMKYIEAQVQIYQERKEEAKREELPARLPAGTVLPGMSIYQQKNAFSDNSYDSGFFGGITQQQAAAGLQMNLPKPKPKPKPKPHNDSPEWAKQKMPVRQYVDGVEHFGKEDSMGFID